jgi:hypothetical protein
MAYFETAISGWVVGAKTLKLAGFESARSSSGRSNG